MRSRLLAIFSRLCAAAQPSNPYALMDMHDELMAEAVLLDGDGMIAQDAPCDDAVLAADDVQEAFSTPERNASAPAASL